MLESFRKGQRWLTLIFVAAIGGVFIFFFGSGGGGLGPATPTGNAVVQLDDVQLMLRDFQRVAQQREFQLREQLGEAYDQLNADQIVATQSLDRLVTGVVLAAAARDMGLHVTTDEVRRVVAASPAFIDPSTGRFSKDVFRVHAEQAYGTQRNFTRAFTRDLLGQKLLELLSAQTTLSDDEIDLATRYTLEEARIAYAAIDALSLPPGETVSDEDAEAWADENEDALRETFNMRAESLATPEQVRARHILVRVPEGASDDETEAARARAQAARDRILAGEAFGAVAGALSDDLGTKDIGGDLGRFARGSNDPALDAAAFELEAGAVSEVIRSDVGWHVVRVDEKIEAEPATWQNSRLALAREGAAVDRAATRAQERAEVLVQAIAAGSSLEDAARDAGMTLERPPALTRRPDGFVPGLGAAEALMTTVFTLEAGESSQEIFDIAGQKVLVQVLERTRPDEATIAARREEIRANALVEKQNAMIEAWVADTRRQLEEAGRLKINAALALGS
ncbi:MAG: SurA N-terminal domain-containing protein [Myxococcota bacterium]